MIIDKPHSIDSLKDGTKEVADFAHEKANLLSTHFDSKVTPHLGKYGNVAKFAAELVPGVAEYNAIKEGDWKGFAIAAGIDIGAIAVGAFSAGAGYASIKGSSALARAGVKAATKEIAEAGAKNTAKEIAEFSAKKAVKETVDAGTETAARKAANEGIEKAAKNYTTDGRIVRVREKVDGFYTSFEDRVKCSNLNGDRGFWDGERGRSVFHPSDIDAKKALKELGLDGIEFVDGEADFSRVATETVKIDNMTARRLGSDGNYDQASTKLAEKYNMIKKDGSTNWDAVKVEQYKTDNGLTWHERCDCETMDLVPTEIHSSVKHSGGVAECKARDGVGGVFDE